MYTLLHTYTGETHITITHKCVVAPAEWKKVGFSAMVGPESSFRSSVFGRHRRRRRGATESDGVPNPTECRIRKSAESERVQGATE